MKLTAAKNPFLLIERINMKHLRDLLAIDDGGLEVIEEVFAIFQALRQERMHNIVECLDSQDFKQLGREIHSFKVSCYNIGALRASAMGREIQTLIEQENFSIETLRELINLFKAEINEAVKEIDAFILGHSISSAA